MHICLKDKEKNPNDGIDSAKQRANMEVVQQLAKDSATRGNKQHITNVKSKKPIETNVRRNISLLHQENVIFSCNRGNRRQKETLLIIIIISNRQDEQLHKRTTITSIEGHRQGLGKHYKPRRYNEVEAYLNIHLFYHLPRRSARLHGAEVLLLPQAMETVKATPHLVVLFQRFDRRSISSCMEFVCRVAKVQTRYLLHTRNPLNCPKNIVH